MNIERHADCASKCDGKQPQCSQCVLRYIPCSGYRQEFIFISQSSLKRGVKPVSRIDRKRKAPALEYTHHTALECVKPADSARVTLFDNGLMSASITPYELEDDIQFIVDYFAPTEITGPAEMNPYHDQICGVWVGILYSLPRDSRKKQYFSSAVKTLATSLRRHGFRSRRCEPDMLKVYGDSIGRLGTALEEARGSFELDLGVAILCLAVADVSFSIPWKVSHTSS